MDTSPPLPPTHTREVCEKPSNNGNGTLSNLLQIANLGRKAATSAAAKQDTAVALPLFREAMTLTHDWLLIAEAEVLRLERVLGVPAQDEHAPKLLKDTNTLSVVGLLGVLGWKIMRSTGSERMRRLQVWRELRMVLREFVKDAEREVRHLERVVEGKHRKKRRKRKETDGERVPVDEEQGGGQPHSSPQQGVWPGPDHQMAPPPSPPGPPGPGYGSAQAFPQQPKRPAAYPQKRPPPPRPFSLTPGGPPTAPPYQQQSPPGVFFPGRANIPGQPPGVHPGQTNVPDQPPPPHNQQQLHWPDPTPGPNSHPLSPTPGFRPQPIPQPPGNGPPGPQHHDWAHPPGAAQEYYSQQPRNPAMHSRDMPTSGMMPPHHQHGPPQHQPPGFHVQPASERDHGDERSAANVSYISSRGTASPGTPMQMPQPMRPMPPGAYRSPAPSERRGRSRTSRRSQANLPPDTRPYAMPSAHDGHYPQSAASQYKTPQVLHERYQQPTPCQYEVPQTSPVYHQQPVEKDTWSFQAPDVESPAPSVAPQAPYANNRVQSDWTGTMPIGGSRTQLRASWIPSDDSLGPGGARADTYSIPRNSPFQQQRQAPGFPTDYGTSRKNDVDNTNGSAMPKPISRRNSNWSSLRRAPSVQTAFRTRTEAPSQQAAHPDHSHDSAMPQPISHHGTSGVYSQRAWSARPDDLPYREGIQQQASNHASFARNPEYKSPPASRVDSRAAGAEAPSKASHGTRRSRKSDNAPQFAPSSPLQQVPFIRTPAHEAQPAPRAESRAPAADSCSHTSHRTHCSRKSSHASSAGDPASRRGPSRIASVMEEEPLSDVEMFADLRKPPRPKVCHHLDVANISHCDSVAFPCEVLEDGVTLNKDHLHSKDTCGYDA